MKKLELTNEQLKKIQDLSNTVVSRRNELLSAVCEILGKDWYMIPWCGGCSYALHNEKEGTLVAIETYRFASPTSYALKALIDLYSYTYFFFDKYGNLIR